MKIAIDALGIGKIGGGRSATFNLLEPLLALDQVNRYLLFLDKEEPELQYPNVRQIIAPVHERITMRLWAQATWPQLLRHERVQLIHHTKNLVTLGNPCPAVATIHDLTMLTNPEIFPAIDVFYYRTLGKMSLRSMEHLIAVSRTTASDLMRFYHIPDDKITVIHEGISDGFVVAKQGDIDRVRLKYQLSAHYLVHLGSIWPKKNLATLVYAYENLVQVQGYSGDLVLIGRPYRQMTDPLLEKAISECHVGRIIRTGAAPQEDLPALLGGADCFVFPSLHEGFGLAPLEAMACGVPVVAARSDAIDEVLGNAALLVEDPRDVDAFCQKIRLILGDLALRNHLISAGLERTAVYSRERAARQTLSLYQQLVDAK
ncbi:MAG: glycosyltransferase family 4 protein [Chloroflexi bacterium]|nr:glycosyltransferase family 4 protein [Chloroflexota bacterium]